MLYEECKTPYEYIKRLALQNRDTDSIVKKAELLKLCEDYGIASINEKSSKEDMIDALTRTFGANAFAG